MSGISVGQIRIGKKRHPEGDGIESRQNDRRTSKRGRCAGPHSGSEPFYRHGIRAVGVEAIAQAARTNKTTLFGISRRRMNW
jgi:hypothetical protein